MTNPFVIAGLIALVAIVTTISFWWPEIHFWFWRRRVAGMLHHWFKWPVPVAWDYAKQMRDYYTEGCAPEDAIEEDRQYWE